jgi:hypothetical protein
LVISAYLMPNSLSRSRVLRIGEQRQFLLVQGVIGIGQCVPDGLGRHRMPGRQGGKGGRNNPTAGGTGAVAPVFVPRQIGP